MRRLLDDARSRHQAATTFARWCQPNQRVESRGSRRIRRAGPADVADSRCPQSLANGELAVYGLFYRAESGLFLAYDAEQDSFRPLM